MIHISVLGEQRISAEGEALEASGSVRMLGLLGYLVAHAGVPQPRSQVAAAFWPDSTEAQARTNLRRELHHLRTTLPGVDACLQVDDRAIGWRDDAPCEVDLIEFERAAAEAEAAAERGDDAAFTAAAEGAVATYRGELLPGFHDDWVVAARDRLRRRCVGLLDELATRLAERGEVASALAHAHRRISLEPLEEAGYRALMRLQAGAGDRAAALRTYHRCASTLEHELAVEPSAETFAAYEELITRSPASAAPSPPSGEAVPLVGRRDELAQLQRSWEHAITGPRVTVIRGESGVGKTRVAAEFAAAVARDGGVVARARCFASRGRLALAPVAEWLRTPPLRENVQRLDDAWRTQVGRLVPELRTAEEPARASPLSDAWQRRQFFEGLARAVLAAGRPTLLVLDDVQWCDAETLAWLEVLLHLDPDAPLLVVTPLRSEEFDDNAELVACCRRLRAAGLLSEIELEPLSFQESTELASALRGQPIDAATARRLRADTGGFPLFLVESLREGVAAGSRSEAVLASRIAQLSPDTEEVAALAAAVGRDFSLELLAAAGEMDEDVLVDTLDELWRRRLVREHSPATYDFTHDLLRDAAYERLGPAHRRLVHRRIATALETLHADELDVVAARLADQHERGGQPWRAVRFHARAAQAATDVFAHDDAVEHYERALALLGELPAGTARHRQEVELLEAMVPSLVALEGYAAPRLGAALERMTGLGEQLDDPDVVVRSEAARSANLFVQGRIHDAAALTERLMPQVGEYPAHRSQILLARVWGLVSLGRPEEALEELVRLEERIDGAEESPLGFPVRVMALGWQAQARWLVGEADAAAACCADALSLADTLEHPFGRALAQGYAAIVHWLRDDTERASELAASVRKLCDRYDFAYYGEWGRILLGRVSGGASGEALIREGLEGLDRQHAGRARPFWLGLLAEVLIDSDRPDEAERLLADARAWAERYGDRWWLVELWRHSAALAAPPEAEAMLEHALATAEEQGAAALSLRAATDLARRRADAGRPGDAVAVLARVRARAGGGNPADVAAADALLADARV